MIQKKKESWIFLTIFIKKRLTVNKMNDTIRM